MPCVCGKEVEPTYASPWKWRTIDSSGKLIAGACIHGVYFPPTKEEENIEKGG